MVLNQIDSLFPRNSKQWQNIKQQHTLGGQEDKCLNGVGAKLTSKFMLRDQGDVETINFIFVDFHVAGKILLSFFSCIMLSNYVMMKYKWTQKALNDRSWCRKHDADKALL